MPLGPNDLKNVIIPSAWDGAELQRLQLRDGTTYEQIIADINAAIQLLNNDLTAGYEGQMLSLTDDPAAEYRTGATNGFEDATEYAQPDAQRGETTGHMYPLRKSDRKMGWTVEWLEECRRGQVDADIAAMLDDARNLFGKRVLTRHFKLEVESGRAYGLGASGVSVGWADGGAPAGTVPFTPPPRLDRAAPFSSAHTHYLRLDGITQTNLETAVKHVWEHGHDGPFELLISQSDVGAWSNTTNVTGFVRRAEALIQYGQDVSLATVDAQYIGAVQTNYGAVRIYASARIPTGYWSVFKSYGRLDMRNPLKVRFDPLRGFGLRLVSERVELFPLAGAVAKFTFGVGVGDRTAAVVVENDSSGDYATPTIS